VALIVTLPTASTASFLIGTQVWESMVVNHTH